MKKKQLIPCIYMQNGRAVTGFGHKNSLDNGSLTELASFYSKNGADALLIIDFTSDHDDHDKAIADLQAICNAASIPCLGCGNINRMEDIKKILYTGCKAVVLNGSKEGNLELLEAAAKRFGREKILVSISDMDEYLPAKTQIDNYAGSLLVLDDITDHLSKETSLPLILHTEADKDQVKKLLLSDEISGVTGTCVSSKNTNLYDFKDECALAGITMNIPESKIAWSDFKLNSDGLIPVIVQDVKTDTILMLAYMNEESFNMTLHTGRMTYWSRSRKTLWMKGETSGHLQYMQSLTLDCDHDTILAKVIQIGPACHTGNPTCFFNELYTKEGSEKNPLHIFENLYQVIEDRRAHPKEGSYTNYLFDKGIDKILKKVGEENTEIIIAAKNPDSSEIKYEISDYLYHLMVLMAERGVTWEEITDELSRR